MVKCRMLPYNPEFLGAAKSKLVDKNVFVRNIEKGKDVNDLHEFFESYGNITSAKIALNEKHESRGYGFVCF